MQRFIEFFDTELAPLVRRMADRPRHPTALLAEDSAQIRATVWQGLTLMGAPVLALPPAYGGQGASQAELVELTELLGRLAYQGPLLDTVTAADLLLCGGATELLGEIAQGATVALAVRADGAANPAEPGPLATDGLPDPSADTLDTQRRFVGFAAEADLLLVVGTMAAGLQAAVVPRRHPSVSLRRYEEVGRGELFDVRLARTPVRCWLAGSAATGGDLAEDWAQVLARARIRQAGYLVGLAQGALDLTVAHAKTRRQFGQPIGRFQALAFRLSEHSLRIDAARLLVGAAAQDTDQGLDARLGGTQCLATAADVARAVTTAAMQINGAAGMLIDNDAQLYYRRAAVEALWLGSPSQLRSEALPLLSARVS